MNYVLYVLLYVTAYLVLSAIVDRKLPGRKEIVSAVIGAVIVQLAFWYFGRTH